MIGSSYAFSRRLGEEQGENALARALAARRAAGLPVLNLAESNPTRAGAALPPASLLAALASAENARYDPDPRGLFVAREAIARRYAHADPDRVFCAASTSEAYGWLFKLLCDPGDAVLVPKPGYPLFDYLAGLEGIRAEPYRLEYAHPRGWSLDLDALEGSLVPAPGRPRVRALVLIHPNNPTGSYVAAAERQAVLALAERYHVALIVDEVFRAYALDAPPEPSFADEARVPTLVLDGLSKLACAPQVKLGWIYLAGPPPWRQAAASRLEIIADAYLSASAAAMNAAPGLLSLADAHVAALRLRLSENLAALRAAFDYPRSPFRVLACQAGWTALLEVPRLASEEALALGLLSEEGLYVQPGYLFDIEREGVLALSLLLPPPDFAEGVFRLRRRFEGLLSEA